MTVLEIPKGSVEFIVVTFNSLDDLTLGTVQVGLSPTPLVQPSSWLPAIWPTAGLNVAQSTSPVDTSTMALDHYQVWAKLTDSPEIIPRVYGNWRIV